MKKLFLHSVHEQLGAKWGAFSDYTMPLSYNKGIIQEHLCTRTQAGLFDVSHMGQCIIEGKEADVFLNAVLPVYADTLPVGKSRYTLLLNEAAGIMDDVILTRRAEQSYAVVLNAARIEKDMEHMQNTASQYPSVSIRLLHEHVLLALQGPNSEELASRHISSQLTKLLFMRGTEIAYKDAQIWVNRSGYTGEDGFELSVPHQYAEVLYTQLVSQAVPVGLGARNTLRLEAGLSLFGHDIDETTNPFEARLGFALSKKRLREEGSFIGKEALQQCAENPPSRIRVGIKPEGKLPVRDGTPLYASALESASELDKPIGRVTSGGFSPSLNAPIALAYVKKEYADIGQHVWASIRGKFHEASVSPLPFVPHARKEH